jgi:hypothetical protein
MVFEAMRNFIDPDNNENVRNQKLMGLIIEDHTVYQGEWSEMFDVPNIAESLVISPNNPANLAEDLQKIDPSRVNVIIVDQFYEQADLNLRVITSDFISRVRSTNSQAWIIEQSFTPQNPVYRESNVVVKKNEIEEIFSLVNRVNHNPANRLDAIRRWSNSTFLKAQRLDPNNEGYVFDPEVEWEELINDKDFNRLRTIAKIPENFSEVYSTMKPDQQRMFLHTSWSILGHLSSNSSEDEYSFSLQRLSQIASSGEYQVKRPKSRIDGSLPLHYAAYMKPIIWKKFLENPEDCNKLDENLMNAAVLGFLIGGSDDMIKDLQIEMVARHFAECPYEGYQGRQSSFSYLINRYPKITDNDDETDE